VGPFAKQILNYSYPPLLYQRGDGEEEDEDEEDEDMEEDDDAAVRDILEGGDGVQLPDFADDDDDEGDVVNDREAHGGQMIGMDEEEYNLGSHAQVHGEDENESDIHDLLKNAGALGGLGRVHQSMNDDEGVVEYDEEELYRQIQKAVAEGHGQQFIEQLGGVIDEHGNVFINN
jgi:hypothetical protein